MKTFRSALTLFGGCLLAAGCYPKAIGPEGPDGERLTWAQMDKGQRMAHMASEVLPIAQAVFGKWRPDKYAQVDCSLCHGSASATGDYKMPTAHLPRLSGDAFLGPEFEKHKATTDLKLSELVPAMGEALGKKTFSIVTKRGFGCYSCHLGPKGPMFGN